MSSKYISPACFLPQSPPNMFVMNGSKKPVIFADLKEALCRAGQLLYQS
jgi:hypothetical protein